VNCRMKHVKALSTEKPMKAAEVAWVQLKDIIGIGKGNNLSPNQSNWLSMQKDNWLQS